MQADLQDIQKATVLAFKYALDAPELLKGEASRSAFINFTNAVAAAHPIDRYEMSAFGSQCPDESGFKLLLKNLQAGISSKILILKASAVYL